MGLKGVNPNATIEYILRCEKENNDKNPTIFGIRPMTGADSSAEAADLFNTQKIIRQGRTQQIVRYDPVKWENMMINKFLRVVRWVKNYSIYDDKKKDYVTADYEGENVRVVAETLKPEWREEIFEAAEGSLELSEGEKKS